MNVKLLAACALLVQIGALLVNHNGFIIFFAIVQCYANASLQAAKLFQQHWRHLKGNYDLNSVFGLDYKNKSVPAVTSTNKIVT
jgi:hypothetical protein